MVKHKAKTQKIAPPIEKLHNEHVQKIEEDKKIIESLQLKKKKLRYINKRINLNRNDPGKCHLCTKQIDDVREVIFLENCVNIICQECYKVHQYKCSICDTGIGQYLLSCKHVLCNMCIQTGRGLTTQMVNKRLKMTTMNTNTFDSQCKKCKKRVIGKKRHSYKCQDNRVKDQYL
jgi:hypothetical protein